MKNRHVLVTGGTGFLGQRLARRLQEQGEQVTVLGRNKRIGEQLQKAGIRFVCADIADQGAVRDVCYGKQIVIHAAAFSSPWGKYRDMYAVNVEGTRHVVEGCLMHNVERLVHVSTPSLYFAFEDKLGIRESDPLPQRFANAYAETKYLAEREVDNAFERGLATVTIRPRALFGPGDNAILPRLIRANKNRFVPMIDGGQAVIDLTYVDNVVDALLLCMDSPEKTLGSVYNITNGEPVMLIDVLESVFAKLDMPLRKKAVSYRQAYGIASVLELLSRTLLAYREPMLTRYTVGVLAKSQTLDITKAREELGYEPRVSLREGIDIFANWWRQEHERNTDLA
ncbi:NAD-dependent epimerase/dehydratase family protein [Brevibacillus borstelensis]|uniref:NAD-dependent epimerase/dehydratase family protein n=1 Tax=Brevibacillus borstelensis TaxID=45462 RepID=UPI0030C42D7A